MVQNFNLSIVIRFVHEMLTQNQDKNAALVNCKGVLTEPGSSLISKKNPTLVKFIRTDILKKTGILNQSRYLKIER